jgi:putative heme utilization carrier protein HutX
MSTTATADIQQRVASYLAKQPRAMTLVMARELALPEAEVIRNLPADRVNELDVSRFEEIMERCAAVKPVHVLVSNESVTLEGTGELGNFSRWGEFFNVQTKGIDMHIRPERLASAFAVQKPSHMDGAPTVSVQFFDQQGNSAFKIFFTFGQKAASQQVLAVWQDICEDFRK